MNRLEYPTECRACGWLGEDAEAIQNMSGITTWCPFCGNDDLIFHKPKEDRLEELWEQLVETARDETDRE